jgi:heptosyltransferase-2
MRRKKILIIRFSSFGDIVQAMSVLPNLEDDEVHWLTKQEFKELIAASPLVSRIWTLEKGRTLFSIVKLFWQLKSEQFDIIYDAHQNLRSSLFISLFRIFTLNVKIISRPKDRLKRFFLFYLKLNLLPTPFQGIRSYLSPLTQIPRESRYQNQIWKFPQNLKNKVQNIIPVNDFIVIAPSAAWEMKRWPIEHWKNLILQTKNNIIIVGGPGDHFCQELAALDPARIFNFAGKLSLLESCYLITLSKKLISADTGMLHVADLLNIPGIALIGPTAFGFTTGHHIKILEVKLNCRPCSKDGRGRCSQKIYQRCMKEISPEMVINHLG